MNKFSRKEFTTHPRQFVILLLYDHLTNECKPLEFGGKSAACRALAYQEELLREDENTSSGLIMNQAAEIEFENTLLSELGCPHEVGEDEFDDEYEDDPDDED